MVYYGTVVLQGLGIYTDFYVLIVSRGGGYALEILHCI